MNCPLCNMKNGHKKTCNLGRERSLKGIQPTETVKFDGGPTQQELSLQQLTGLGPPGAILTLGICQGKWAYKIQVNVEGTLVPVVVRDSNKGFANKDAAIGAAKAFYVQHVNKLVRNDQKRVG